MPELYDQLNMVMSDKAVALKQEHPRRRFDLLIEDLGTSCRRLLESNEATLSELLNQKRQFQGRAQPIIRRIITKVFPDCERILNEAEEQRQPPDVWRKRLETALGECTEEVLRDEIFSFIQATGHHALSSWSQAGFRFELPDFKEVFDEIRVSKNVQGRMTGEALGAGLFGLLGSSFGPLGMMIGGYVGGKIGGAIGERNAGTETVRVAVGTNRLEIMERLIEQLDNEAAGQIIRQLNHLADEIFPPMEQQCLQLRRALERLRGELVGLKFHQEN